MAQTREEILKFLQKKREKTAVKIVELQETLHSIDTMMLPSRAEGFPTQRKSHPRAPVFRITVYLRIPSGPPWRRPTEG